MSNLNQAIHDMANDLIVSQGKLIGDLQEQVLQLIKENEALKLKSSHTFNLTDGAHQVVVDQLKLENAKLYEKLNSIAAFVREEIKDNLEAQDMFLSHQENYQKFLFARSRIERVLSFIKTGKPF